MSAKVPQTLFEVVAAKCKKEIIHDLLKQYRDAKILGPTKPEMIDTLRVASEEAVIPIQAIQQMVQECEENGDQHILLYKPKSNFRAQLSATLVGKALFPKGFAKRFPSYETIPNEFTWSDFRVAGEEWTAKFYGHQIRRKRNREDETETEFVVYFDKIEDRIVCSATWRAGILQLRIGRDGLESNAELLRRIDQVWSILADGIDRSWFVQWNLEASIRNMITSRAQNAEIYQISNLILIDSEHGISEFSTQTDDEDLFSESKRCAAIETLFDDAGCRQSVISFLPAGAGRVFGENPLRAIIGAKLENCVTIRSSTTRAGVAYVLDRLREFA